MYLLDYSELIKNLVISDLKTKYASSVLGFAWSLINPLFILLVLYFVFKNVFSNESKYVLYILIGLFVWRFFSIGSSIGMTSIISKPSLVTKVYIPREILTFSNVVSSLISSYLEFLVLLPIVIVFGATLSFSIILFPFIHLLFFLIVYGLSLILASLFVYFRDLSQIWEVSLQAGFFACPVFYMMSFVPEDIKFYYLLNPITRLLIIYRDIFLYGTMPDLSDITLVAVSGIILMVIGSIVFSKLSRRFAEEL